MDHGDIHLLWCDAKVLIDRHGEVASLVAGIRADEMAEQGDPEGETAWRLICEAVLDLQAPLAKGEKPN